jgi:hypothetical protein
VSSAVSKDAQGTVKVCQWLQRGDLAQYLRDHGALAPLEERLKLVSFPYAAILSLSGSQWRDVVAGVAYLHNHDPTLIHGDLKPVSPQRTPRCKLTSSPEKRLDQ